MGSSKEFDALFKEMQNTNRSNEARHQSWMNIQDKVGRTKKRYVAPIFISLVMVAVAFFLVISLINQNPNSPNQLAAEIDNGDKNKAAIRAVLEKEFTGPDEEYLLRLDEMFEHQEDPSYEVYVGRLTDYMEETYSSYFTESGLDGFTRTTPAFSHHYSGRNYDYQISISDIEVVQSDNPKTPKSYSFTGLVEYEDEVGETSQYEIQGKAICSEEGKIGRIQIVATELEEKIRDNRNNSN